MKRFILLLTICMLLPALSMAQSKGKAVKEVSPFIEGKQKVRQLDYDSIWKFTSFDAKKVYYCNYDYTEFTTATQNRHPQWGNFSSVMNFLTTQGRTPARICAVYAVNPTIEDGKRRNALIEEAQEEALASLEAFKAWAVKEEMKNKFQFQVAQVDYRYWKGTEYFTTQQPSDELIHVGLIIYFGTKKINLFPSSAEGAQSFKDIKFFPNDATVVESYEPLLDSLASYILQNERLEVLLRGYSDNVGTNAYNTGLSRQRCVEIKKRLLSRGVPEHRIEIEAKGSDDPIGDNNTYEGRIANNRVQIVIQ